MNKSQYVTQLAVGFFFLAGMVILAYFTIILSSSNLLGTNNLYEVIFDDVSGLENGNEISLHGVPIGKVKSVMISGKNYDKVLVVMNFKKDYIFYEGYNIIVKDGSLLGGQYLDVKLGKSDKPRATFPLIGAETSNIIVQLKGLVQEFKQADIIKNIKEFTINLASITQNISNGGFLDNMKIILTNLEGILESVNNGNGSLGKFIKNDEAYSLVLKTLNSIENTFSNVGGLVDSFKNKNGTLNKLLTNDEVYNLITKSLGGINKTFKGTSSIMTVINDNISSNKGAFAKIINDEELYNNLNKTLVNANAALEDLREQAPIQTFGSLIFNAL